MIEIREVTKKYGKFTAVDKLSMTVDKGSVYGLVGYNGAGKTTLLKTVAGIYRADGGSVTVDEAVEALVEQQYLGQRGHTEYHSRLALHSL